MLKKVYIFYFFCFSLFFLAQERSVFDIARNGTFEEMKTLIEKNPEAANALNERSFSPLILACYRGNVEVANFLIDKVDDINYKSSEGTALAALAMNYNKILVEKLLQKGADPNIVDGHGYTPLLWAVKSGQTELAEILLKNGADKNAKDSQGISVFEHAVNTQNQTIINLLKSK